MAAGLALAVDHGNSLLLQGMKVLAEVRQRPISHQVLLQTTSDIGDSGCYCCQFVVLIQIVEC
jgi:hypothetical protein